MEIELPPPLEMRMTPVPLAEGRAPYYPDIVEAFEALGFRRIGGVHLVLPAVELEELVQAHPAHVRDEFRASTRTPETVLAAPDSSAFVGVDWFYRQPSVRLRSLLADGTLVETQRGWDHLPVPVTGMEPYVDRLRLRPEQHRGARGRRFTIVPRAEVAELWAAHRRALSAAGSQAVEHRTVEQTAALWQQVVAHDEAIERNVAGAFVRYLRATVMVSVAAIVLLVLAGIYGWASDGAIGGATPWLVAATLLCFATAFAVWVMGRRLMWWLRYTRRIRPAFGGQVP